MNIKSLILLVVFLMVVSACQLGAPAATATPTINATGTAQARNDAATQAALDKTSTAEAEAALATGTALAGKTATAEMRVTQRAIGQITADAQDTAVALEATSAAEPMAAVVQDLFNQGFLNRAAGTFYALEDWEASQAKINYFFWYRTDYTVDDFVFRAHWAWDSASPSSNWYNSGCGIVFREVNESNYYYVSLRLNGYVRMLGKVKDVFRDLGSSYATNVDVPAGEADIMLVVEGNLFRFWVNGDLVHTRQDNSHSRGKLAFSVSSGTNAGFGTRCTMTDIELWTLD